MSDNAEAGIAQTQARAAQAQGQEGLAKHQGWTIAYLDERILIFAIAIGFIGLMVLWATAKSPLLLYGSLAGVILLTCLWGYARIKRQEALQRERDAQAAAWKSDS